MNKRILIITRSFPPDSNIASVRPAKLAKYLQQYGYSVTVIRSGLVFNKPGVESITELTHIRVLTYESEKRRVIENRRSRYNTDINTYTMQHKKDSFVRKMKRNIGRIRFFKDIYGLYDNYIKNGLCIEKRIKNFIKNNLADEHFDYVISTFMPLGVLTSGRFAKRYFSCKWVADFRDLMDNTLFSPTQRLIGNAIQKRIINEADLTTTVSEALVRELKQCAVSQEKVILLRNGYDGLVEDNNSTEGEHNVLTLCYTGTLYGGRRRLDVLLNVINHMDLEGILDSKFICIRYAGSDYESLHSQAQSLGLEGILHNHGLVSRDDVWSIQKSADLFLVASWNTENDQGILTGKFYESIQNHKPVIAIVTGNVPNSELRELIERYNLGVCYEEADHEETFKSLHDFLQMQYDRKQQGLPILYEPDKAAFEEFHYKNIVKQFAEHLEGIAE